MLVDFTPVECARSVENDAASPGSLDAADSGYCASHSRFFWGFRLHALFALDGTPRALALTTPKVDEKTVCLQLVARCERQPGQMLILIGDKNFRGRQFEADLANAGRQDPTAAAQGRARPRAAPGADPPAHRVDLLDRQDILTLERHRCSHSHQLLVRLACRFAALAAAVTLNHRLGRPTRSLACYTA